jgi:hypothetical protein
VKQDITLYTDFKDDDHFSTLHRKFVATAHKHHTHLVLDPTYVPKDDAAKAFFEETQVFMYVEILQVLASKQAPDKNKKRQVNEGTSAPSTVTIDCTTYYLH